MKERFDYLSLVLWGIKYRRNLRKAARRSKREHFRLNEWIGVRLWALRYVPKYRKRAIFTALIIADIVLIIACIHETAVY